jgi:hypothetical protein
MTGAELLTTYPEAAKVIVKYYSDEFLESLEKLDAPAEFIEFAKLQELDEHTVAASIDTNPRLMFNILDDNKLYVGITPNILIGGVSFKYTVGNTIAGEEPTRVKAEFKAIELAVAILNDNLIK